MLTNEQKQALVDTANDVRQHAYAPYSKYSVGAALLAQSGKIYSGVNVENAAYPVSMCAERTAIFKAVSEGETSFSVVAVVTDNAGTPCGSCRQVLAEFGLDLIVLIADSSGKVHQELPLRKLLPYSFGPDDLETDPSN
jgi:cytidine deaminase